MVASQKSFLESLQKDNDRRVTDAKKFGEAQRLKKMLNARLLRKKKPRRKRPRKEAKKSWRNRKEATSEELTKNEVTGLSQAQCARRAQATRRNSDEKQEPREHWEEFKKLVWGQLRLQKNTDQAKDLQRTDGRKARPWQRLQAYPKVTKAKERLFEGKTDHDAKILSKS